MISICMITRDESKRLDRCLAALSKLPAQLVVVDTGSKDDSVQVAQKYTDKVFSFEWCNDFSAARNYAAACADNDWILMVDTDEYLTECDWNQVCGFIRDNRDIVGRIVRRNVFLRDGEEQISKEYVNRLYDRRNFCYAGAIHEQIVRTDGKGYDTKVLPMYFDHDGYNGDEEYIKRKADRNIRLLSEVYENNPNDPYIIYQLGKSYFMKGDYEKAYEWFHKATFLEMDEKLEYVTDLIVSYGYAMLRTDRAKEALGLTALTDYFGRSADFMFMLGLVRMNNMQFEEAVDDFMAATHLTDVVMDGGNSYKAYYNAGVIYECLGDTSRAIEYYKKCAGYPKAAARIDELSGA